MNAEEAQLLALAAEHYGVVARREALDYMTERQVDNRVATGRWAVVHPGVYRIVGAPVTTRQEIFATTQWIGDCAVSHVAAGRLLRLESVPKPSAIDISCDRRTGKSAPGVVVHRSRLHAADLVTVDGIPCTSATRTVIDLAASLDAERLETAFESARKLRLTSPRVLAARAAVLCRQGNAGSGSVKELLRVLERQPLESRLEVKVARLLRENRIHVSANQFVVGRFRLDFAWPERLLGLECDGFEHHGRRLVWKRDRRRIAALEAAGWRLIQLTCDDVTRHPVETVLRLRVALQRAVA